MMTDAELSDMARRAQEVFDTLTPEQQEEHRRQQAASFVYGNLQLDGIDITEKQAREAVDRVRDGRR